jgi:hypothetical protein
MLKANSPLFTRTLQTVTAQPVIDCHEHIDASDGSLGQSFTDPIQAIAHHYITSDLLTAGASREQLLWLKDPAVSLDERWAVFAPLWQAVQHTAYGRVTRLVLQQQYGLAELTRASLDVVAQKLQPRSEQYWVDLLHAAGIRALISDVLSPSSRDIPANGLPGPSLRGFLEGQWRAPAIWHGVFSLPGFHDVRSHEIIEIAAALGGAPITRLEDYEQAVFTLIRRGLKMGLVALKDQSAYRREIAYDLPPRADAERLFNRVLIEPRCPLGYPESKPLDDYLFHQFVRFAGELGVPVQIHTGHMAGFYNRVDKANAVHLAPLLEMYPHVQFDLFHGNWPYMGDLLFLAKNYANVTVDLCWLPAIDPLYCVELIKRLVMTAPNTRLHAFGGDYRGAPEYSVAHLSLARECIATALTDLVEMGWLSETDVPALSRAWLFDNPNRFFHLGLEA